METRWLETFVIVAREGSMSTAAQQLGYARSTVTGHIQSLERSLGAKLLDRRSGQALTMSGVALLEHGEDILKSMERARSAVTAVEEGRSTPLRIGATESVCAYRLPMFLGMLGRLIPGLKVEVETAPVGQLCQQAVTGRQNLVLIAETQEFCGSDSTEAEMLCRRVLWEEEPLMVGIPAAVASPRRVLLTGRGCVYREVAESDFLSGIPDAEPMQVGNLEGVKSAVLAGLGVGLLPSVAIQPWLASGELAALPLRTSRTIVTAAAWNDQTCPTGVVRNLRKMGRAIRPLERV
jgi:DNA-binding transcriptional LysR family regulator